MHGPVLSLPTSRLSMSPGNHPADTDNPRQQKNTPEAPAQQQRCRPGDDQQRGNKHDPHQPHRQHDRHRQQNKQQVVHEAGVDADTRLAFSSNV